MLNNSLKFESNVQRAPLHEDHKLQLLHENLIFLLVRKIISF